MAVEQHLSTRIPIVSRRPGLIVKVFWFCLLVLISITASPVSADQDYWEYTFRPGDSIWKIAREYTTSVNNWHEISRINNIGMGPDRSISPGTRIKIPVAMLKQRPTPAILVVVQGEVQVIRASGEQLIAEAGTEVFSGDKVLTRHNQSARIRFADQSELQVLADSEITFDKLSYHKDTGMVDTQLRLPKGRISTWIEKLRPKSRFEIQTPAALTAVRGTQYRLTSENGSITRTEVTEGQVAVSAEDVTRQVPGGYGLVAETGKPLPEAVKLLSAPEISANLSNEPGQLDVSWSRLDGAAEFRCQIALDESFNRILVDQLTPTNSFSVSKLEAGDYHVRIRAMDANRLEGLNAVRRVRVAAAPEDAGAVESVIIPSGLILGQ